MDKIIKEDTIKIIEENDGLKELKDATIVITGASGMVGSYFANTLITLNELYDMNITIVVMVRNVEKLSEEIRNNGKVVVIQQDVIDPINYDGPVDYVIHAASPASPLIMREKPFETNLANTVGTSNTLRFAKNKNAKGYLFISSREIYGEPLEEQKYFTEDGLYGQVNPLVPRNGYAEGKKAAENMCVSMHDEYGLNTKIVRLAHTYGPGMSIYDGRVQADFLKNAINGENIIMKSNGLSSRTYMYIGDAITEMFHILLGGKEIVYNVADEKCETTIRELAEVIANLCGTKVIIDIPDEDQNAKGTASFTRGILSSERYRSEFGESNNYSIKDGFSRTIKHLIQDPMLPKSKRMKPKQ